MKKTELTTAVDRHMETTYEALQLIWDNTNKGQRKKLLKNEQMFKKKKKLMNLIQKNQLKKNTQTKKLKQKR